MDSAFRSEPIAVRETLLKESTVLDGLAIRGTTAQNDQEQAAESVQGWLNGLGLSS